MRSITRWSATVLAAVTVLVNGISAITAVASEWPAEAPVPIVERHLTIRDRQIRTTLFSNGVVVVSGNRDGERIFFRQVQLEPVELTGYVSALERDAIELPTHDSSRGYGVVTLYLGPKSPLRFTYSSMTVYDLTTTRLLSTLDDLEQSVIWREPTGAGIEGWEPETGDWVRLRSGGLAKVVDVQKDGTIVIEHASTYINEVIPEGQRKYIIFEVVDDEP